jgi:hypothetical protein
MYMCMYVCVFCVHLHIYLLSITYPSLYYLLLDYISSVYLFAIHYFFVSQSITYWEQLVDSFYFNHFYIYFHVRTLFGPPLPHGFLF